MLAWIAVVEAPLIQIDAWMWRFLYWNLLIFSPGVRMLPLRTQILSGCGVLKLPACRNVVVLSLRSKTTVCVSVSALYEQTWRVSAVALGLPPGERGMASMALHRCRGRKKRPASLTMIARPARSPCG